MNISDFVIFWKDGDENDPTFRTRDLLPLPFSPNDESKIINYLAILYSGLSPTAVNIINDYLAKWDILKIYQSFLQPAIASIDPDNGNPDIVNFVGPIGLNLDGLSELYSLNDRGRFFQYPPELAIIHEMIHEAYSTPDLVTAAGSPRYSQGDENGPDFDFVGQTLRKEQVVAQELGLDVRVSYDASVFNDSLSDAPPAKDFKYIQMGISYTEDNKIGIAIVGDLFSIANNSDRDDIDLSLRPEGLR